MIAEAALQASALEAFVRRLRFHSDVSKEDADVIRALPWKAARRPAKAYLIREGDPTDRCAVLIEGIAHRFRITQDGERQILALYLPGDPVNFDHLLLPVADDSIQAARECLFGVIRHDVLKAAMIKRRSIGEAVIRAALVDASTSREWTLNVGRRDARTRIAHLLCEISTRLQAQDFSFTDTPLPLVQDQIADATGLTAVHVNRTLKAMSADRWIVRRGALVMLPDPQVLRSIVSFDARYLHLRDDPQSSFAGSLAADGEKL